jgi:hypothetical protein
MKYKFQIENGSIYDGNFEIIIKDYIAEIDNPTEAMKIVIEAHGGQLEVEEKPKKKRKVKSVKWEEKEDKGVK